MLCNSQLQLKSEIVVELCTILKGVSRPASSKAQSPRLSQPSNTLQPSLSIQKDQFSQFSSCTLFLYKWLVPWQADFSQYTSPNSEFHHPSTHDGYCPAPRLAPLLLFKETRVYCWCQARIGGDDLASSLIPWQGGASNQTILTKTFCNQDLSGQWEVWSQ